MSEYLWLQRKLQKSDQDAVLLEIWNKWKDQNPAIPIHFAEFDII